jgi:hypothetical protein
VPVFTPFPSKVSRRSASPARSSFCTIAAAGNNLEFGTRFAS